MNMSKEEVDQLAAEAKPFLGRTITLRILDRKTRKNVDHSFTFVNIPDPIPSENEADPGFYAPQGELRSKTTGTIRELTLRKIINYCLKA
jgi:hypothetical protein